MRPVNKIWLKNLLISSFLLWTVVAKAETITVIPRYDLQAYDKAIAALYAHPEKLPVPIEERIQYFSRAFLGQPYVGGALGEGPAGRFDKSPLFRTDGFDCLTYVSTVLALANANHLNAFKEKIQQINYQNANVSYRHRNHFTSVDWNVNNRSQGFIQDITNTIKDEQGHPVAQIATAYINKKAWYEKKTLSSIKLFAPLNQQKQHQLLEKLHGQSRYVKNQQSYLPYIPLDQLFDQQGEAVPFLLNQIPSGSIIEIVRPNWNLTPYIGTHLNVSHLGFALRTEKGLVYREASSVDNKVIDILLVDYLKKYLQSPTVKGINVQLVLGR
jgi:hypothetical protein